MKNRKMRWFSHVMTVVLMMSMMLVNILPTHAVGSTPAPVSETINFGANGTLKINVKPTSQTEVSGTDNISTGIEIDGTGLTQPVDGLYLEVELIQNSLLRILMTLIILKVIHTWITSLLRLPRHSLLSNLRKLS